MGTLGFGGKSRVVGPYPRLSHSLPCHSCPFRDRSCTVLNVEGDAFGAGLLQNYVDRSELRSSVPELIQVKSEMPLSPLPAPIEEGDPLLKRRSGPAGDADPCEKESVM